MSHFEEYEYLIKRSRRFYETALIQIDKGFYDLAAFSLEQSLQLFLKAVLLKMGLEYPRTHSVRRLLELVYEISKEKEVEKLIRDLVLELALLEDAYITSRYIPREYGREEVLRLKKAVDEVMEVVGKIAC
ncbi:HEPN domain-containing protein [Ignisphaera sp. 4213-co]|uniref:HEPN domain-containing protein n=1 Tax=Ignisphaera cupida TaxID=3050454 RepID=A0ABD4Z8L7_9CREN|nr:HEPN domain-containing protein [Ignisphaera sp. 4213-co]MDK6028908.1 HEPN domain-containing protein [Ignisphaera sp. 4213-co]